MRQNWQEDGTVPGALRENYAPMPVRTEGLLRRFWGWLMYTGPKDEPAALQEPAALPPERREQIREALREWQAATAYFENVTDPTLVDYAVFDMEAAQKRYMYLLKSARKD